MSLLDYIFGKKVIGKIEPSPPPTLATPIKESRLGLPTEFPFPVIAVTGDQTEAELIRLRKESGAGKSHVIIGTSESALTLVSLWDEPYDLESKKAAANELNVAKWFAIREENDPETYETEGQEEIHEAGTAPMTHLSIGYDPRNRMVPQIYIASLPTDDSCEIPLYLRFGNWNDCPSPEEHTALARYWKEKYGAEIATVASDIVEYTVSRPPQNDEEAMKLAWEQYFYCNDIVDQGVGSVATLAKALRHSTRWYFWWD